MHTQNYILLQERFGRLKALYLPSKFDPVGEYDDDVYELVSAFKVLVHAEIEYYFEEIALTIAMESYKKWESSSAVTKPIVAMVAYYEGKFLAIPNSLNDNNRIQEDLNSRIETAFDSYNKQIRNNNNGIKAKNILSIFLPIGIQISELEEQMLISLDNFGKGRGIIAHSTRPSILVSPEDALNEINHIMSYLDKFDDFLYQYKNSI